MPVLARLDEIDGVESSYANGSGTLIRLSLRPGADSRKVSGVVRRVLHEQTGNLVPVPINKRSSVVALQREEWRDQRQVAELTASEAGTPVRRAPTVLVVLLLGWVAVGFGLLWWRQCKKRAGAAGDRS